MTRDIDVRLELEPDTSAALRALPAGIYTQIDQLALTCATRTTNWQITVRIGTAATIHATPAHQEKR